jgi:hypothetical protein
MVFKSNPSGAGIRVVPSVRMAPLTCAPIKTERKRTIVRFRICRNVFMV